MTYQEIKERLSKCELTLSKLQDNSNSSLSSDNKNKVKQLTMLKESLQKQLNEADKGVITTDDEDTAKDLADKGSNVKLTVKERLQDDTGVKFTVDETKSIAKKVGEAVAKSLKSMGDEVAHMKGRDIEENSFDIFIEYKNGSEDNFSFYIVDDGLHLTDFSFDKEITDVGVKPSGEAVVNVDVVANELTKHFKGNTNEVINTDDKPELKKLSKALSNSVKAHQDQKKALDKAINTEGEDSVSEAPDGVHYIKVERTELMEALEILEAAFFNDEHIKFELNDPNIIYIRGAEEADIHDAYEELQQNGIIVDETSIGVELQERDINDPVLMKMRAAKNRAAQAKHPDTKFAVGKQNNIERSAKIKDLEAKRAQVMRDMEQEAEPEGGTMADKYGSILNKIDQVLNQLRGTKNEDAEEKETDDYGRPYVDPKGSRTFLEPDEMSPHSRFKKMAQKEDTDVGHQDDEPDMLQATAYEIATYAAKLSQKLAKYDAQDGEIDFPHWWQAKLVLAKDYMSKAFHYLDSEEKQPALDQLALEEANSIANADDNLQNKGYTIATELIAKLRASTFKKLNADELEEFRKTIAYAFDMSLKEETDDRDDDELSPEELANKHAGSPMHQSPGMDENADYKYLTQVILDANPKKNVYYSSSSNVVNIGGVGYDKGDLVKNFNQPQGSSGKIKSNFFYANKDPQVTKKEVEKLSNGKIKVSIEKGYGNEPFVVYSLAESMNELNGDQQEALMDLQDVLDQAARLGEEAREIVREKFPNQLSRGDSYGIFNFGTSGNQYDHTLESMISDIEEEDKEDQGDDMDEGVAKTKKAHDRVVTIMKGLAKKYRDGDESVVDQLKTLTITKKKLEDMLDKAVAGTGVDQELDEAGPGFAHDCAAKVVHETYGKGKCIPEKHTLVKEGKKYVVTHYDVLFENGKTVQDIPVDELDIKTTNEHWHKGYKKKKK